METEEGNYYNNGYMQDPLQDFIDDVLLNQPLPNYDQGKISYNCLGKSTKKSLKKIF
jgi:hypothetical protein